MIKFSHSIFALPFALSALLLAVKGFPSATLTILIILAMIFARNTAMAFNRLVDADIDAKNPRTSNRQLPRKILSSRFVSLFIVINAIFFITTTYFLNTLAFALAPLVLIILCFYSYTKRFTHYTQIFLGLSLGIAPVGAWIAATGKIELEPLILGLGVFFWVAGFDLIYATQDSEFDKKEGLKSMVVKLGISRSLWLARYFHGMSVILFFALGWLSHLGSLYQIAIGIIGVLMIYEHQLVTPKKLSHINAAFFTVNGIISFLFFIGVLGQTIADFYF